MIRKQKDANLRGERPGNPRKGKKRIIREITNQKERIAGLRQGELANYEQAPKRVEDI